MGELFVDTNVFLRYLTNDDPRKAESARKLFESAVDGKARLRTSLLVIAEIVWTLESFYNLDPTEIARKVEILLNTPNLNCPDAPTILKALDFYATRNVDFIDAYHAYLLPREGISRIATWDRKHFRRADWLELVEL